MAWKQAGAGKGSTRPARPPGRGDTPWLEPENDGDAGMQPEQEAREYPYPEYPEEAYTCLAPHERWWRQGKDIKYKMFSAASDGCLWCVQWWLEEKQLDSQSVSDNQRYNLLDYAVEARMTENVSTGPLEAYLVALGMKLSHPVSPPGRVDGRRFHGRHAGSGSGA